jgi:hypothetical protein
MQFEDEGDMARQRFKQVLLFMLLPIIIAGCFTLAVLFLPLYMVAMIFIKPYQKAIESSPENGCCSRCCNCEE